MKTEKFFGENFSSKSIMDEDETIFSRAIEAGLFVARVVGAVSQVSTAPTSKSNKLLKASRVAFSDLQ